MILRSCDANDFDYYVTDLSTGAKNLIIKKLDSPARLSPNGKYVAYYNDKNWFLYNIKTKITANLTDKLNVSFADEDDDTPSDPRSYGIGGWIADDKYLLIYDKYDIWKFDTDKGTAECMTDG